MEIQYKEDQTRETITYTEFKRRLKASELIVESFYKLSDEGDVIDELRIRRLEGGGLTIEYLYSPNIDFERWGAVKLDFEVKIPHFDGECSCNVPNCNREQILLAVTDYTNIIEFPICLNRGK